MKDLMCKVIRTGQPILFILFLGIYGVQAQISNLPHSENFDKDFVIGNEIDFLPNWWGNEVETSSKIFQTAQKELGIIPTSSYTPEIHVKLNLITYQDVVFYFKAKSAKNGDGNRPSLLYMETSNDGGVSWNTRRLIHTFPNADGSFANYQYRLAGLASNKRPVVIRITAERSEGEGTAAAIIIDDVQIQDNQPDDEAPEVVSVTPLTSKKVQVRFNDKMNATALELANYQGMPFLTSITPSLDSTLVTLDFSNDFGIGRDLYLTIQNVEDKAGNKISAPHVAKVVYNNTRPSITITEIMYNTPAEIDSLEFLEIYNKGDEVALLGGLYFSAGLTFIFPEYDLAPKSYVLIAANAQAANDFYGQDFLQWEAGALNNGGENLEIKNSLNQVVTSVKYERYWGGDGDGRSISYCFPVNESGNNLKENWSSAQASIGKSINGIEIFATPNAGCANVLPEVRFEYVSTFAFEGAEILKIKVMTVNPNGDPIQVKLELDPASTAVNNVDFAVNFEFPKTIDFTGSKREEIFDVQILDDNQQENVEQIIFKLTQPQNSVIGSTGTYTIDVLDNDAPITQLCVNELSASNNSLSGIKDEYGNADDWIEIKNGSNKDIVIAGYYVTDNPNNLTKYQLPINNFETLTVPAGGYLILWADNETEQGANHLDFALSASGEYFALVMPDGITIVSEVTFPEMKTNTSYGRVQDCDKDWVIFETPTFMAQNKPTSVIERKNGPSVILYPNPNKGEILYSTAPIDYNIYDAMGKLMLRGKQSQQIDVQNLQNGWYILTTEQGEATKFMIIR